MRKFLILLLLTGCSVMPSHQKTIPSKPSPNTPAAGRTTPPLLPDHVIAYRIIKAINHDPAMVNGHIIVSVRNGRVLLRGTCISIDQALQADAIAGEMVGVKQVIDNIKAPGRA